MEIMIPIFQILLRMGQIMGKEHGLKLAHSGAPSMEAIFWFRWFWALT